MKSAGRIVFLIIGLLCLALALLGALLPILPTTPFALLAAACFGRSSDKLHEWLLRTPALGPALQNWQDSRSISLRTKISATLFSFLLFVPSLILAQGKLPLWALITSGMVLSLVLLWIWTRKSV